MQHLEGSGTPVLYIRRTILKGKKKNCASNWSLAKGNVHTVLWYLFHAEIIIKGYKIV